MAERRLSRHEGRAAFGSDPAAYHRARPDYPGWVMDLLRIRCGLRQGSAVLEIGAGTGKASRPLLEAGADPLVAIEPDPRLAAFLRQGIPDRAMRVIEAPFETAALEDEAFDIAICATAFHWLDEDAALARIARMLRPGGWWAAFWNVFGDDSRPDPFHLATRHCLTVESPSAGDRGIPFALDKDARLTALARNGRFTGIRRHATAWSLSLDADETVALYATYSNVAAPPDREAVLAEIGRVARDAFGDRVTRNMTTVMYLARRTI